MGIFINYCAGVSLAVAPAHHLYAILTNSPQNAGNDIEIRSTQEMFKCLNTEYTMNDSGGYQILKKELEGGIITYDNSRPILCNKTEINITPELVVESNMKLKPQKMTTLDVPIPKVADPHQQYHHFINKLGFNLVWMRETALLREKYCPEIELFIPIQAYTLRQFTDYIEKPLMELCFDGISLPTRNLRSGGITLFLLKFYQLGIRKIHLLSVSNVLGLALAAYFARNIFDWCSVDATTWRLEADKLIYMDPRDFHAVGLGRNASFREGERPCCECPWCRDYTFTGILNIPMTDRIALIRSHNYYVVQKAGREFYENSVDLITLELCLKKRARNTSQIKKVDKLIKALQIATYMRNVDIKELEKLLWKL